MLLTSPYISVLLCKEIIRRTLKLYERSKRLAGYAGLGRRVREADPEQSLFLFTAKYLLTPVYSKILVDSCSQ